MKIRLYNFDVVEEVLGPYKRAIIWTQGCPFKCTNCMTPDSLDINGGIEIEVEKLAKIINNLDVEGITISGGEPFLWDKELSYLMSLLENDLGVIVYTGYLFEEVQNKNLLKHIDLLIDGKYEEDKNDGIAFRGSSNQKVYFLTKRYEKFKDLYNSKKRKVEIRVNNNKIEIIGIPSKETLKRFRCL